MSKKRVGIYIEEEVWKTATERAWEARKSVSAYIEDVLTAPVDAKELIEDVIIPPVYEHNVDADYPPGNVRGDMVVPRDDDEVLGEAQVKLDKLRERKGIVFNPQPKKGK